MTILDQIVADKRAEVARLAKREVTADLLREKIAARGGLRPFRQALLSPRFGSLGLIAEIKKASPSAGVICPNLDPAGMAKAYESGGASCLSVLTDRKHFQGSLHDLKAVRRAAKLPLLRKDFVIDARQILEAVEWGADAVLLIAAILDDPSLAALHQLATAAGLDALVEVHDEAELERALRIGAGLIGVNNRNLRNFAVDLEITEKLASKLAKLPNREALVLVSESGVRTREDAARLARCGAQALLVGEALMRAGASAVAENIANLIGIRGSSGKRNESKK